MMEYMGNMEYWDEKFATRENRLLNPEKSIVDNIKYFKKGSVLDIACGDGRNALFLMEKGFEVTGIDFSSTALSRLQMFAIKNNYLVNTKQIDLSKANSLNSIGIFDNVLINHYRLSKEQFEDIESNLTDDGILFICGFGYKHKTDSKISKEDLIQPTDFENLEHAFELIKQTEDQEERGFFVAYIFRKKKNDFDYR